MFLHPLFGVISPPSPGGVDAVSIFEGVGVGFGVGMGAGDVVSAEAFVDFESSGTCFRGSMALGEGERRRTGFLRRDP